METETVLLLLAGFAWIGSSLAMGFWLRGREVRVARWLRSWLPSRFSPGDVEVNASVRYRTVRAPPDESD